MREKVVLLRSLVFNSTGKPKTIFSERDTLFGSIYGRLFSGDINKEALLVAYRRFGFKTTEAVIERMNKLDKHLDTKVYSNEPTPEYLRGLFGREVSDKEFKHCEELYQKACEARDNGMIFWHRYRDIDPNYLGNNKGYVFITQDEIHNPVFKKSVGKSLQLYCYLKLTAAYAERTIQTVESVYKRDMYLKIYKGEVLSGKRTMAKVLGMSPTTVTKLLDRLEEAKLIRYRKAPFGRTRIIRVVSLTDRRKFKKSARAE